MKSIFSKQKMFAKERNKMSKTRFIAMGFLLIIVIGSCLLMLPISSKDGSFTDPLSALFTATSATCVTGLVVADTYTHWSIFGQTIIITMIQIGGLGFMSLGVFIITMFNKKVSLRERGLMQESVGNLQIGGIVKLVKKMVYGTLMFEGIGAIVLTIRFSKMMRFPVALYNGIFHSISAFCNAGFDLMGRYEKYSSFVQFYDDPVINITFIVLIFMGGLGFFVWDDILKNKFNVKKYTLHTKLVLTMSFSLLFGAAVLFYITERGTVMADMSVKGQILSSMFCSMTPRTAGFNTVDISAMSDAGKLLTIMLMFVGGSPGSTAGGVKTTTIVALLLYLKSTLLNANDCNVYRRKLEDDVVKKASAVFMLNLLAALVSAFLICAITQINLVDVLFETFSAIGTVGMSTGITRQLTVVPKIIVIILMYCGRIGSLSFVVSFMENKKPPKVSLPSEKIMVG